MKNSIYCLIANALSAVAAFIFLLCTSNVIPTEVNAAFEITALSKDSWEIMKLILPVLSLSIVHTAYDCTRGENHKNGFVDGLLLGFTAAVTVFTIGATWVSICLQFEGYSLHDKIELPLIFIICYAVTLLCVFLAPIVNKKNQNLAAALPLVGFGIFALSIAAQFIVNHCF